MTAVQTTTAMRGRVKLAAAVVAADDDEDISNDQKGGSWRRRIARSGQVSMGRSWLLPNASSYVMDGGCSKVPFR